MESREPAGLEKSGLPSAFSRSNPFVAGFHVIERCRNGPRQSRRKNGSRQKPL